MKQKAEAKAIAAHSNTRTNGDESPSNAPTRHPSMEGGMDVDMENGIGNELGEGAKDSAKDGAKDSQPPGKKFRLTETMKAMVWELVLLSNECCRLENEKKYVSLWVAGK